MANDNNAENNAKKAAKKITKLVPSGAELEPIVEEGSERSEDSSFSDLSFYGVSQYSTSGTREKMSVRAEGAASPIPEEDESANGGESTAVPIIPAEPSAASIANMGLSSSLHEKNEYPSPTAGHLSASWHARSVTDSGGSGRGIRSTAPNIAPNPSTRGQRTLTFDYDDDDDDDDDDDADDSKPKRKENKKPGEQPVDDGATEEMTDEDDSSHQTNEKKNSDRDRGDSGPMIDMSAVKKEMSETKKPLNLDADDMSLVEKMPDPEDSALTWRLDPLESLSDWKIVVSCKETDETESYHVHKNILAVGPRKSEYFGHVFRDAIQNGDAPVTNITFERIAARVVPAFLDFMYSKEGSISITTRNATAIRYVAKYFGVRVLHKKVMTFMRADMSMSNVDSYYLDGENLHDDRVTSMAAKICAKSIMDITPAHPILKTVVPEFFQLVLSAGAGEGNTVAEHSSHLSLLLSEYCKIHRRTLDFNTLQQLSDEKHMPTIHYKAALFFLEIEADLNSGASGRAASGLKKRCLTSLALHWKDLNPQDQQNLYRVCQKLESGTVSELLFMSLADARRQLEQASADKKTLDDAKRRLEQAKADKKELENAKRKIAELAKAAANSDMRGDYSRESSMQSVQSAPGLPGNDPSGQAPERSKSLGNLKGNREKETKDGKESDGKETARRDGHLKRGDSTGKLTALKKEYDEKIASVKREHEDTLTEITKEYEFNLVKLRDLCLEKDKHITNYWNELKRFERFPNTHDGKLVASGRSNQPSKMPDIGKHSAEGFLYAPKKGGKKHPIFYYNTE